MGALHLSGRQAELGVIATILRDVRRRGTALVLAGPAGIGKSSLLEHASQVAARAGHRVLRTVGVESEQRMSFAGLAQLLRPVVSQTSTLPALQKKALRGAMGLDEGPAPEVFLVGLAALNLLSDVASEQPVVVLVDDAQWLDAQSLAVLAFLARRVAEDAVALVVAMRDGHPSSSTLTGLRQMQVLPLNEQSAREILRDVAGDLSAADQERILAQSLGNPLALVELPAAWRSAGSAAAQFLPHLLPLTNQLERAFAGRLPELPELTRTALLVGAVDTEGELDEILAATRMMVRTAVDVDVLEPAARVGLITYDHAHLHFRHPLVKSGILQAESTVRRQAANAALADVLQHQPLRRVWYRAQSIIGTNDAVADELEASSTELARRGSSTPAVTALERAAQLTRNPAQRGRRLLLAAELAVGVGQSELVTRLLNAAASHSLTDLDHARLEWIREIPGESDFGDAQRVLRLVHIAERAFLAPDVDLGLNLLVTAALRCWWANADPIVGARVVAMAEEHTLATDDPRYIAVIAMAQPLHGGRVVDRLLATVSPEHVADPEALLLFGMAAFAIGDQPRAADFLDRAESRCRLQGRLGVLTRVLALQSPVRIDLGDWKGAVAAVDEGRRLAVDTGQPVWGSGTMASDARVHALLGDAQQARELAAAVEASAGPRRNACLLSIVQLSRGFALMNAGRHLDAFEALRRAFTAGDPSCHAREALSGLAYLAEAGVYAGRRNEARDIVKRLEVTALRTPSPILHTHLSYARALLADDRDAERLYASALQQNLARWPLLKARIQLAYGSWLRRQRRAIDARSPLRSAEDSLKHVGASLWADRARSELRAAGERQALPEVASPTRFAAHTLTVQEMQIARLAAQGLSNREIGERLFLSHRTVGAHLHSLFPKLDITSRGQIAARFSTHDGAEFRPTSGRV